MTWIRPACSRLHGGAAPALLALALLVGAAGCADQGDPGTAPSGSTPSPTTSSIAPAEPSTATREATPEAGPPPFSPDIRAADGGHGSGNGLGLTGVRAARHPGFDRVVFDLGGTGTPGWRVDYRARPVYEGSGDPVPLDGTVFLQVILRGVGLPYDTGLPPFGDQTTRVPATGTRGISEIAPGGVFEGEQGAFIGLTGVRRPFRVFALTHPTRVVVDVRHR